MKHHLACLNKWFCVKVLKSGGSEPFNCSSSLCISCNLTINSDNNIVQHIQGTLYIQTQNPYVCIKYHQALHSSTQSETQFKDDLKIPIITQRDS